MSEMVERVARAIWNTDIAVVGNDPVSDMSWVAMWSGAHRPLLEPPARAAIAAMHEPTEAMTDDGRFHGEASDFVRPTAEDAAVKRLSTSYVRSIWQTMISAALK